MLNTVTIRTGHRRAGRSFVFLFNRVSMYGPGHPFSVQAIEEFYLTIQELLKITSPIILIHARGQFFIEDEALDRNLNYSKMLSHFKKAKVASISIQKNLEKREVEDFVNVLLDTRRYPSAEHMRKAAAALKVTNIKINHIFYQKVTEDDQVVAKSATEKSERLNDELESSRRHQEALGIIAGKLLMDELDQGLSIKTLLADPKAFSQAMVARDLSARQGGKNIENQPNSIIGQLRQLHSRIQQVLPSGSSAALSELAEALVKMKSELLSEIEVRKPPGIIPDNTEIREHAGRITDAVVLELVRKEYDKGKTSVERLAFVLQRIIPNREDLKSLLPAIKASLMGEGMPIADFYRLIKELGANGQNEEIVQAINQGAEDIGVDGSDLLGRLRSDPAGFARFLYLASEIEKEAGSSKPLCDIMVDHLERISPRLLNRGRVTDKTASDEMLRNLVFQFHTKVIDGLRSRLPDSELVNEIEQRLREKLESSVQAIRAELADYKEALKAGETDKRTLLQSLEDSLSDGNGLKELLKQVRADSKNKGLDENDFQQIFELVEEAKKKNRKVEKQREELAFSKQHTAVLLDIEVARAVRYGTDLSVITFSVLKMDLPTSEGSDEISSVDVTSAILRKMQDKLRSTDWIGTLDNALFIAVLPMTTLKEAHIALRRLLKSINADPTQISGQAISSQLAGSVVHYDAKIMPDKDALIGFAQNDHLEMAKRLRGLHDYM